MARSAAPIAISSRAPEISFDELTTCLAEASAILWEVRQRRDARLAKDCSFALAASDIQVQEEKTPTPKVGAL